MSFSYIFILKSKEKFNKKTMENKKMNSVAAMALVFLILLSANTDIVGVAAQGVNCWDSCNTACVGLPRMSILSISPFSIFILIVTSSSTLYIACISLFLTVIIC